MAYIQKCPDIAALRRRFEVDPRPPGSNKSENQAADKSELLQPENESSSQQLRARWNHTFPPGPESRKQALKLVKKEDDEKVAAEIERLLSLEPAQHTPNPVQHTNSQEAQPLLSDNFEVSPPQTHQKVASKLNQDNNATKRKRPISSEAPLEACVHAMMGFGQQSPNKGKGKQRRKEAYRAAIQEDSIPGTPSPDPLNWQKETFTGPATRGFGTAAEPSRVYIPSRRRSTQIESSRSANEPLRVASLQVLKRYRPYPCVISHLPSQESEDFYRPAMAARGSPGDRSEVPLLERQQHQANESSTPRPIDMTVTPESPEDDVRCWIASRDYYVPTHPTYFTTSIQPLNTSPIHSNNTSTSHSPPIPHLDLPQPNTTQRTASPPLSYILPTTPTPFSTPYGLPNASILHFYNTPRTQSTHNIDGGAIAMQEIRDVLQLVVPQTVSEQGDEERMADVARLETQRSVLLERRMGSERMEWRNREEVDMRSGMEQDGGFWNGNGNGYRNWGMRVEEMYGVLPLEGSGQVQKKCGWWKRWFCKCCKWRKSRDVVESGLCVPAHVILDGSASSPSIDALSLHVPASCDTSPRRRRQERRRLRRQSGEVAQIGRKNELKRE